MVVQNSAGHLGRPVDVVGQQAGHRRLDRGERRAQVVRHRGQQGVAQLGAGLGPGHLGRAAGSRSRRTRTTPPTASSMPRASRLSRCSTFHVWQRRGEEPVGEHEPEQRGRERRARARRPRPRPEPRRGTAAAPTPGRRGRGAAAAPPSAPRARAPPPPTRSPPARSPAAARPSPRQGPRTAAAPAAAHRPIIAGQRRMRYRGLRIARRAWCRPTVPDRLEARADPDAGEGAPPQEHDRQRRRCRPARTSSRVGESCWGATRIERTRPRTVTRSRQRASAIGQPACRLGGRTGLVLAGLPGRDAHRGPDRSPVEPPCRAGASRAEVERHRGDVGVREPRTCSPRSSRPCGRGGCGARCPRYLRSGSSTVTSVSPSASSRGDGADGRPRQPPVGALDDLERHPGQPEPLPLARPARRPPGRRPRSARPAARRAWRAAVLDGPGGGHVEPVDEHEHHVAAQHRRHDGGRARRCSSSSASRTYCRLRRSSSTTITGRTMRITQAPSANLVTAMMTGDHERQAGAEAVDHEAPAASPARAAEVVLGHPGLARG